MGGRDGRAPDRDRRTALGQGHQAPAAVFFEAELVLASQPAHRLHSQVPRQAGGLDQGGQSHRPRFVEQSPNDPRRFADLRTEVLRAVRGYVDDVGARRFPSDEESYHSLVPVAEPARSGARG